MTYSTQLPIARDDLLWHRTACRQQTTDPTWSGIVWPAGSSGGRAETGAVLPGPGSEALRTLACIPTVLDVFGGCVWVLLQLMADAVASEARESQ